MEPWNLPDHHSPHFWREVLHSSGIKELLWQLRAKPGDWGSLPTGFWRGDLCVPALSPQQQRAGAVLKVRDEPSPSRQHHQSEVL